MIGEITNHVWQSTVFAAVVALVALAFRKNRAEVRYWLWLSASLKFLVPFSLLMSVGTRLWDMVPAGKTAAQIAAPTVSAAMVQIAQPFPETFAYASSAGHATNWIAFLLIAIWTIGFVCIAAMRFRGWVRIRAAVRKSTQLEIVSTVPVHSSQSLIEPGVVGFLRPVLLLPEGIVERLTPSQLAGVLAHEECHVRRQDNLTSVLHMIVEAAFWFYPVVWWIGAKLVEERERACDEAVLALGGEPQVYAEGILNVCKSYLESPLRCVSGVTGSDLKKRIRRILADRVAGDLSFGRKIALIAVAMTAIVVPVVFGLASATVSRAQSQAQNTVKPAYEFEVASVKLNKTSVGRTDLMFTADGFTATNFPLQILIQAAYGVQIYQVVGMPSGLMSEKYDINAKMNATDAAEMQKLGLSQSMPQRQQMLQALLADRFKLIVHHEARELPVFALVIAKGGSKLQESKSGDTALTESDGRGIHSRAGISVGGRGGPMVGHAASILILARLLSQPLGRPVLDQTGLTATYDFTLQWKPDQSPAPAVGGADGSQRAADSTLASDPSGPSLFTAIQEQLGLKLESTKGPVDVIVIDHIERPSGN